MRAFRNVCSWRPVVGVAVLGIFALGLTVQAAPGKDRASSASRTQSADGGTLRDVAELGAGRDAIGQSRVITLDAVDGPTTIVGSSPIAALPLSGGQVYSNTLHGVGGFDVDQDVLGLMDHDWHGPSDRLRYPTG